MRFHGDYKFHRTMGFHGDYTFHRTMGFHADYNFHRTMGFPSILVTAQFSVFYEYWVFRVGFPHILTLFQIVFLVTHTTRTIGFPYTVQRLYQIAGHLFSRGFSLLSLPPSFSLQSISRNIISMRPRCFLANFLQSVTYRGEVWGFQPPPRNSEGPPKSCQTQPSCENC